MATETLTITSSADDAYARTAISTSAFLNTSAVVVGKDTTYDNYDIALRLAGSSALYHAYIDSAVLKGTASGGVSTFSIAVRFDASADRPDFGTSWASPTYDSSAAFTMPLNSGLITIGDVTTNVRDYVRKTNFSGYIPLYICNTNTLPGTAKQKFQAYDGFGASAIVMEVTYTPTVWGDSTATTAGTGTLMTMQDSSSTVTTASDSMVTLLGASTASGVGTAILRADITHRGNGAAITGCVTTQAGVPMPTLSVGERRWDVKGGPVTANLTVKDADDLLLSEVRLFDERGAGWHGWVWDAPKRGNVTAIGSAAPLSMVKREACYCDTATGDFTIEPNVADFGYDVTVNGQYVNVGTNGWTASAVVNNDVTGYAFRLIPNTSAAYASFSWVRPSTDWYVGAAFYTGDLGSLPSSSGNLAASQSSGGAAWTQSNGSGNTSGTGSVNMSSTVAGLQSFAFYCSYEGADFAPTTLQACHFYAIKVYGVKGLTTIRPDTVITDCVDRLPTWALPSGSAYRAFIDTSSVTVEPLVFDADSTDTDKIAEVIRYDSMDYYWAPRFVGMEQVHVPVYTAKATAAALSLDETRAAFDFTESDMETLASVVRVNYHDADGRSTHLDVTDTDETHYLVRLGLTAYTDIYADTSSSANASALGTLALTEYGTTTIRGTISTSYLRSGEGAPLPLSEAIAGKVLDVGDNTTRITQVSRVGSQVTLTCDSAPYRLDATLARIPKRGY